MNRLNKILLAPHLSEKSLLEKEKDNVYVFRCRPDANKSRSNKQWRAISASPSKMFGH